MDLAALIARYHRAFNDRDFDVWREVFDDDVELVIDGMAFRGVDAAVAYGVGSVAQFPGLYIESERIVAETDDTVVAEISLVNGDPASGHSRQQGTTCEICRVRDGRIVSCRSYYMAETGDGDDAVRVPARGEAARIAEEQTALRRVATLVARGVSQDELFAAVTQEVGWLVGADPTSLMRFERDDTVTLVAAWSARDADLPIGFSHPVNDELRSIRDTGRPWRWGPAELPLTGPFVEEARRLGIRSAVGVPIVVDGHVWGVAFASATTDRALPDDAEARIAGFTELMATAIGNAQARAELRVLVDEQAALRRVATLVARESPPDEIFGTVAEELLRLFDARATTIGRLEDDGTLTIVAAGGTATDVLAVGTHLKLESDMTLAEVVRTGRSARVDDYSRASEQLVGIARRAGVHCSVAVPIMVHGSLWGALGAGSDRDRFPADADQRMAQFSELVATAISNIQARSDLAASRARIIAAADGERRRVVRDLHDGAQQRLVHTVITLKLAQQAMEHDAADAAPLVTAALDEAQRANYEIRELAHGILPAVLTRGGLRAGVEALASRMPVPVDIDVSVGRLPAAIEATAYFVVAEALTNVAKHARARSAAVSVRVEDGTLRVDVSDDGIGGAVSAGSGLLGLRDRLSVMNGRLRVESSAAGGTLVAADIPLPG
jgi:signal transduction histidine kinase/ketosteroid isomerase-like protein